uniref:Uncharacterized protein n=1 Tax=Ciona savignyi TaxID=51511 RepID=H2YZW1_CIOSA
MENVPSNPSHAIDMSQNIPTANTALLSEPVTPSVNDLNPEESNTIQNNPTSATVTGDIFDNADQSHSTEAEPILSQTSAAFSTDNPINTQTPCKNVAETTVTNASTPAQEIMKKVPEKLEAIVKTEQTAETLPAMQENDPTLEEGVDDEAFDDSVETLDSIKVKTELDFQISPASLPSMSHSRTSSLSSKSSKTPSPRSSTS